MKNKLFKILFSTRLMAVLFVVFAIAMIVGTFLDRGQTTSPTPYSRAMVYNAWWFEAIMILFVINFIGNIFRYRLLRKEKLTTLILHLSFIFILVGAGITRYIGYEGVMRIREGASNDKILSERVYLSTRVVGNYEVNGVLQQRTRKDELVLSDNLDNDFEIKSDYNQQQFTISHKDFIGSAKDSLVEDENGKLYLKLVEATGGNRHDHYLEEGKVANIHNRLFSLNKPTKGAINIIAKKGEYPTLQSPFNGTVLRMADQKQSAVIMDSIQPLQLRSLYDLSDMQFVIPEPVIKGRYELVEASVEESKGESALTVTVSSNGESKDLVLRGGKGFVNSPKNVKVGGLEFDLSYGSVEIPLPFSIKLNDFIAEKHPGNDKAFKSFMSKVTVQDKESYDFDIYMNNILDHGGYRFFQSSFDNDEKGTVLSVNHDWWGTWISYIGYFLLFFGLIAILVDKNARFRTIARQLAKIQEKKSKLLTVLFILMSGFVFSQEGNHKHQSLSKTEIDSILSVRAFPKEQAAKFGALVIQDANGRMKPVNTYASELLRKLSEKDTYAGLDANQVFLSMLQYESLWFEVPIIKLKRGNDSIRRVLGVPLDTKHVSLANFFSKDGKAKITNKQLEEATRAFQPNKFQQDIKRAYQNQQLLSQALLGTMLKVFPDPNSKNNKWMSYPELNQVDYGGEQANKNVKNILPYYIMSMYEGNNTGDYSNADKLLEGLKSLQRKYSDSIMPSERKVEMEVLYNKYYIFKKLVHFYSGFGILLFIASIVLIFYNNHFVRLSLYSLKSLIILCYIGQTAGLIARWYISGHAPWSDAYESLIYVSWATVSVGLLLGRRSNMLMAATAFGGAMLLWVADLNFIDPAIGNLQPVLDSYWLLIHVAIIVASYGPFTLGAILGFINLLLFMFTNKSNKEKVALHIKELTIYNEMLLTIGLVMLTIGNFLGGMWANESWGRYWGWDPKETWALISIMTFALIIHMRLVPGLRGRFAFNWMSILGFYAIIFTYFGVNFYLVGLHSYASGDKTVTYEYILYAFIFWVVLGLISYWRYKKNYK